MQTVQHQSAPRPQRPKKRSNMPLIAGGAVGAVICVCIALALAVLLLVPREAQAIDTTIYLNTPQPYDYAALNVPLPLVSSAFNASGITRIEIYADGALIAAQDSAAGQSPMIFETAAWVPLTLGRHLLVARAYPVGGGFATSTVVPVDVVESLPLNQKITTDQPIKVGQIASSLGVSVEDLTEANPDLPTDPEAEVPAGTEVEIPPADPPEPPAPADPPAPMPGAPAAPTNLTVSVNCTHASLNWTDAADETSYVVYRLDAPVLTPIATLPADSTSYADPLAALGTFTYQVASAKDGLESLTPMVSGSTPAECAPPLPEAIATSDLVLTMDTLETAAVWDGVYCYFDLNGTGYQRVPAADFAYMTPNSGGVLYDLGTQLPDGGQYHVTADTAAGLALSGECWGKNGPEVSLLGTFSETYAAETWDGSTQTIIAAATIPHTAAPMLIDGNFNITLTIDQPTLGDPPLIPLPWIGWIDVIYGLTALPAPSNLAISASTAACDEFSGLAYLGCLISPPSTITWDWAGNSFHNEAELTRYLITMRAEDTLLGTTSTLWTANVYRAAPGEEIRRAKVLPTEGLPCGAKIWVDVQAFKGTTASTVSTILWQTTDACGNMQVTVTFNTLTLETQLGFSEVIDLNSSDFCFLCTDAMLELDGFLGANFYAFATSQTGGSPFNPCPASAWCVTAGTYDLSAFNTSPATSGALDVTFTQPHTVGLTVWFSLDEIDGGLASPLAGCSGDQYFAPVSPVNWATAINGTYNITGVSGVGEEGQCTLNFTVEGHEIP